MITDDQQLLRRRPASSSRAPLRWRRSADWPTRSRPDSIADWWRSGAELGWTSMLVSEADGGGSVSGHGLLDLVLVAEEMGRLVSPGPLVPTNVVAAALARSGPADAAPAAAARPDRAGPRWPPGASVHRRRGLDSGGHGCGRQPGDGRLRPRRGHRSGRGGGQADVFLVTARDGGRRGPVPRAVRHARGDGRAGGQPRPGAAVRPVRFDQVEVGADAVLGEAGPAGADIERQLADGGGAPVRRDGRGHRPGLRVHRRVRRPTGTRSAGRWRRTRRSSTGSPT